MFIINKLDKYKTIQELTSEDKKLVEVELMLTEDELKFFAAYCIDNKVKFNDWIRKLAYDSLEKL